ncbi:arsenic transporter [Paenibacillus glycanilyticus]|uniref:Arsenical pump membrane protein n=1 Tax=Paenibacillus glycanilyticus TaxID=126569 RepID=A0ABQ6GET6_9BACL|nr:arsenic transporter [Paenibacillus glycanilyticus]GLX67552.1 putative arsenical pump membrane protein [Paenibacillus glycanilyticus]
MINSAAVSITLISFAFTLLLILWRPRGLNEAIPATVGAAIVFLCGAVSFPDLVQIATTVSGAAITIMATIVMAIVLESFGFFIWVAEGLAIRARGSGVRLFWYVNLLCFLMTMFFNNDGSILITTPILLILLQHLGLKNRQKLPYLLSGALVATASSAPIGVSNIVNLIALKIVHMDLYTSTMMMFVPATLGLLFLVTLMFLYFYRELPKKIPLTFTIPRHPVTSHPLRHSSDEHSNRKYSNRFMTNILLFVFIVRLSLFAGSYFHIPIEWIAVAGSLILLAWRWIYLKMPPKDVIRKIPWHILVFAFGMYVIIYGLNNIGLTNLLIDVFQPLVSGDHLNASLLMGGLISILSTLFNNHPALMVGTLTLTHMDLDPLTLKIAYLASVVGSDIGSLLLPIGTLASLLWLHILKQYKVKLSWKDYMKLTFVVIPPTVIFTLVCLAFWVSWLYPSH